MATSLSVLDFILIIIYFIILLAIGYFSSRKESKEDFLIAKRNLNSWQTMATINASKTGSVLMIFIALTYLWGIAAIWYFIGMVLGILIFLPFGLKLKEKSKGKYYTFADYFKYNYGKNIAYLVSLLTIFLMFGFAVINLIAGTKIFLFFTTWPFWLCAIIMVSIVITYLLLGGFRAVVKTDIIQYIAMVIILAMLAFTLFNGSLIPASEWNLFKADIGTMIGFFLLGTIFPFAMPDMWQRVYSAKNKKSLRNGILLSAIIYFIFALLLSLISLTVKAKFPSIDPDLALIYGFNNLLPVGLIGLSVVLIFSAIMSSLDTYIFTASSSIIQDFYKRSKEKTIKDMRTVMVILALLAIVLAITLKGLIISSYLFLPFILLLGVCVLATWINRKIKPLTLMIGFLIGVLATITLLLYDLFILGEIKPELAIAAILSTIIGLLIGGLISYIKKKIDM